VRPCGAPPAGHADDIPKLADWLAEYRSRPEPTEVVVATYDSVEPVPNTPDHFLDAGRVALEIRRYYSPGWPGPPDDSRYVMGVDAEGNVLWDDWYETEQAAREAIMSGWYGEVVGRPGADS
jgi:hypothetical protein